ELEAEVKARFGPEDRLVRSHLAAELLVRLGPVGSEAYLEMEVPRLEHLVVGATLHLSGPTARALAPGAVGDRLTARVVGRRGRRTGQLLAALGGSVAHFVRLGLDAADRRDPTRARAGLTGRGQGRKSVGEGTSGER